MQILGISAIFSVYFASCYCDDSFGLSYLAEHLNKYCKITSHQNAECNTEKGPSNDRSIVMKERQGKAGPRGPPGPPGNVDVNELQKSIDQKLAEYKELFDKIRTFDKFILDLREGYCQVIYNRKCFWFIDSKVNFENAANLCSDRGGHPANIYSRVHYNMLVKYVRGLRGGVTEPWLGMTYEKLANRAKFRNNTYVDYRIPWHPGYPSSSSDRTHMLLSIRTDWNDHRQGIWSSAPDSLEEGVICEV